MEQPAVFTQPVYHHLLSPNLGAIPVPLLDYRQLVWALFQADLNGMPISFKLILQSIYA